MHNASQKLKHIAIIPDGNGRWGKLHDKTHHDAFLVGYERMKELIIRCTELEILSFNFFALSSENLKLRPKEEIEQIEFLVALFMKDFFEIYHPLGVSANLLGDLSFLKNTDKKLLDKVINTKNINHKLSVNVMTNYSGRWDIIQAIQKCKNNPTQSNFETNLISYPITDIDLLIRTGGQKRISNFFLWQAAYAELSFSDKLWPDFTTSDFDKIYDEFQHVDRLFGAERKYINGT